VSGNLTKMAQIESAGIDTFRNIGVAFDDINGTFYWLLFSEAQQKALVISVEVTTWEIKRYLMVPPQNFQFPLSYSAFIWDSNAQWIIGLAYESVNNTNVAYFSAIDVRSGQIKGINSINSIQLYEVVVSLLNTVDDVFWAVTSTMSKYQITYVIHSMRSYFVSKAVVLCN